MVVTCIPAYSFAESSDEKSSSQQVPQTESECSKDNAVLDESTENMTVFENENGSKTAVIYSDNVRFKDEDGNLKDYDPSLVESDEDEYSFENKEGDPHQYFPEELDTDTPIVMTKGDYEISMTPEEENLSSPELDETKVADGYEETSNPSCGRHTPGIFYYVLDAQMNYKGKILHQKNLQLTESQYKNYKWGKY